MAEDELEELTALYRKLEHVYWCFKEMPNADLDDDSETGQEYMRVHDAMGEILDNAEVHLLGGISN